MFSIGVLGFIVWAHHMARVEVARGNNVCPVYDIREELAAFGVNPLVVKHLFQGRTSTVAPTTACFMATLPWNRSIPISQVCRVKDIKARILGACATVQVFSLELTSIVSINDLHTCERSDWTVGTLRTKAKANCLKNIADPQQTVIHPASNRKVTFGLNYVMPSSLIGIGTRSPLISQSALKVHCGLKGARYFARNLSTDCPVGSSEGITLELTRLREFSEKNNIDGVDSVVKSLLGNPDFWIYCYESIRSNPGVHSPGGSSLTGKAETLDGISLDFFQKLSISIPKGRFKFGPIRRVDIPKPQGGTRPLGIADSRDKIVQKGMAVILEELSEHRFDDCSFGSRRGRSSHDALAFIKRKVPSGMWAIEGDISKCFDRFNHKRLVSLIKSKYVRQQVFIDLLYKALGAKIISINSSFINKIGTPQGSAVSPIFSNIYLNELDLFINHGELMGKYRGGKRARSNPKFVSFLKPSLGELKEAENIRMTKGKLKYWKFLQKLRVSKLKQANKLKIERLIYKGENRKIAYVRYVDDFIIFVWGTKDDCLEIKRLVSNFLKSELDLDLSDEKTKITHLKKGKAKFLGFEIWQSPSTILSSKKDVNPLGKIDRVKMDSKIRGATFQKPRIRITFSMESILRKLVDKGLLRFKGGKFHPTSYKSALQYDIANIVGYISSVFRGLTNYYGFAHNWYDAKTLYNYFGRFCAAMTIAHKTKSKVPKVFKKYGPDLCITDADNKAIASYGTLTNSNLKRNVRTYRPKNFCATDVEQLLLTNLRVAKKQLIRMPCVFCGKKAVMHHVKHVRKTLQKKKRGSFNYYLEVMRLTNRKTIPVCDYHHKLIHDGKYEGVSLKTVFKNFRKEGIGFNKKKAEALIKKASLVSDKTEN